MELPMSDITALANVILDEASNNSLQHQGDRPRRQGNEQIDIDQLKKVFMKYPGLIENLNFR